MFSGINMNKFKKSNILHTLVLAIINGLLEWPDPQFPNSGSSPVHRLTFLVTRKFLHPQHYPLANSVIYNLI